MKGRILTSLLTVIALTGLQAQNIPALPISGWWSD